MPIRLTDQRSSATSAEFQWKSIKRENKKEIQTMSQSSLLILDCWPGNDGVTSEKTWHQQINTPTAITNALTSYDVKYNGITTALTSYDVKYFVMTSSTNWQTNKVPLKTTKAILTLEFNDQERKTCVLDSKTICRFASKWHPSHAWRGICPYLSIYKQIKQ